MKLIDKILGGMPSDTLYPAYGRVYESGEDAITDWEAGKDFQMKSTGQYCSIRDVGLLTEEFGALYIKWSPTQTIQIF